MRTLTLGKGTATVTVIDKKTNKTSTVTIIVGEEAVVAKDVAVEKAVVTIKKGQTEKIEITEGTADFTVTANPADKVEVSIVKESGKNYVSIKALKESGDVTVTVKDSKNTTADVKVTLAATPDITFDKTGTDWNGNPKKTGDVKFIVGETGANTEITILTGTPPYTVKDANKGKWNAAKSTATVNGNKIVFSSTKPAYGDLFTVTDASGKTNDIEVDVVKQLEVSKTAITVLVGQTIDDQSKIKISGYTRRIKVKSNSNDDVVYAGVGPGGFTADRALILEGKSIGSSTIIITDGIVEKTVTVTVENPQPMSVYKEDGTTQLDGATVYELGKFVIKGATGNFEVTSDSNLVKKIDKPTKAFGSENFEFEVKRNKQVSTSGEATITVKNLDDPSETFTFKVKCETLLELEIKVNGTAIPKADSGSNAYYKIADTGGWADGYILQNIKVNDVIEITVKNGSGDYKVEGSDSKIEITQTSKNKTFTIKAKQSGTVYGTITITDKADSKKTLKISKISIQ